jgi:hypothetical protein
VILRACSLRVLCYCARTRKISRAWSQLAIRQSESAPVPPPTRPIFTLASESDLRQRDVQLGCPSYGHLEMVVMHVDGFDHLVDEHSSFGFRCGFPERVYVDLGEISGDLVEMLGDLG